MQQEEGTEEQLVEIETLFKNQRFLREDFEKSLWDGRMHQWLLQNETENSLWIPFWWTILHPKQGESQTLPTDIPSLPQNLSQLVKNKEKLQHESIRIDLLSVLFSYFYVQYLFHGALSSSSLQDSSSSTEQFDSIYSALLVILYFCDYMIEQRRHFIEMEEWMLHQIEKTKVQNFKLCQGLEYTFHILEELQTLLLICDEKSIPLVPILDTPLQELQTHCNLLLQQQQSLQKGDKKKLFLFEKKIHFLRCWIRDTTLLFPKSLLVQLQDSTLKHKTLWRHRKEQHKQEQTHYTNPYYQQE